VPLARIGVIEGRGTTDIAGSVGYNAWSRFVFGVSIQNSCLQTNPDVQPRR
jgi:hypothetical protein